MSVPVLTVVVPYSSTTYSTMLVLNASITNSTYSFKLCIITKQLTDWSSFTNIEWSNSFLDIPYLEVFLQNSLFCLCNMLKFNHSLWFIYHWTSYVLCVYECGNKYVHDITCTIALSVKNWPLLHLKGWPQTKYNIKPYMYIRITFFSA